MQDGVKLERKTKDELKQIAQGLGIEKISALKKDEIIALIREKREQIANEEKQKVQPKKRERPADAVEVKGVLDVMTDGFGFLRMENYMSGKNDIYVSPTQIRRFNLKTGDEIVGDCRPSQDEDKFSPLLFVKTINGDPLEIALKRRPFERLTPIYPKEKISLDTGDRTRTASRLIDLIAPIGKGQRGMIVAPPKAGKTTILKQIFKNNNDAIKIDENIKLAYLSQMQSEVVNESNTILQEFYDIGFETYGEIRRYLGRYGFSSDILTQKIESLSGGEKNILQLAKVSASKANMLLMDEPTSHLDIYSQMALEKAISNYKGAILMISHDYHFIVNCADYVLLIEDKTIRKMSMRKFRKMIYANHFDKDYLQIEEKKKALEMDIASALRDTDFERARSLSEKLEEIIKSL